jgi:vancomycin resistance protein YoaR
MNLVRLPRRVLVALLGLTLLTALLLAAVIDARRYEGRVLRNTYVAGQDVSGMSRDELEAFVTDLDGAYRVLPIRLAAPGGGPAGTGADFGVSVDRNQLIRDVMDSGRPSSSVPRLMSYLTSGFRSRSVSVPTRVDAAVIDQAVKRLDGDKRVEPKDPKLELQGRRFVVIPGADGTGIDPSFVTSELPDELADGPKPVTISVNRITLRSRYSAEQVKELATQASRLTAQPLRVVVGEKGGTIPAADVRTWVQPAIENGRVKLGIDEEAAGADIRRVLGRVGQAPRDARLEVGDDGAVRAVPAQVGFVCCSAESLRAIGAALENPSDEPLRIELREVQPELSTEEVERLGVKERISTFTTKHKAGEDRVKNIHRISDMLRGRVVLPGETFSVNREIGPRTAANGFVPARVIEDGVFTDNFGGGISQFATTMFNAAFYGGMDLVEYQSHSLYIRRYPYGVEATLSFPDPDLKFRNNTPYGVLIWPTYTNSSITVSLYSTKWVSGEQIDQEKVARKLCTIVITTRKRTYVDGRTDTDKIRASYRPEEGVDCNGNPTAGATTTTTRPPRETRDNAEDSAPEETSADRPSDTADSGNGDGSTDEPVTSRRRSTTTVADDEPAPEPTAAPAPPVDQPPATLPPALPVGGPPVTGVG